MKIKSQRDFVSGLMFIVVGVVFAVGATNYSMGTSAKPGAGYFPLILSVLMAILGAVVLFKSLTIETEGGDPIGRIAWRPLIVIVVAIAVFGATINSLGLILAVPLLILISSLAGDEFKWLGVVINSVVLTLFSWLIFVVGLSVSFGVAVAALVYLILIHKFEYFLNARIVGTQIRARAWELLIAMLFMEAAFGAAGLVAAPIYYAYLKRELSGARLI